MKNELSELEKKKLTEFSLISCACYTPERAAYCQWIAEDKKIKAYYRESESPSGRKIFIYFYEVDSFRTAYTLGEYLSIWLERENGGPPLSLIEDPQILEGWKKKF